VAALTVFRRLPGPVRRGLVRAGTPGYTVGAVLVVEHEGSVLVLRQPHRPGWSLPGGLLDRGEAPHRGVERELREETGLVVRVGLPATTQVDPRLRRVDVIYRLRVAERPAVRPGGEAQEARWLTPEQVVAGVDGGPGADGPTREILALLARAEPPGARDGEVLEAPR
jgi:ADP-ribose pyrophosphatase YjhB (NUDIX family)